MPEAKGEAVEDDTLSRHLMRLDRMVRYLLSGRYGSAAKLWKLQLDLLSLQQDIQGDVTAAKSVPRNEASSQRLFDLRYLRAQARQFGDAIAWLFLGLDRQQIIPLADNSPVRIPDRIADEHSTRGLIVFAQEMANRGWGFPLLHDITDCLRVGDVTFIAPSGNVTVEVKTRLAAEQRKSTSATYTYELSALAARPFPDAADPVPRAVGPPLRTPRDDRRVPRQIERMHRVQALQEATPDDVTELKGEAPHLTRVIDLDGLGRFDALRRVARRARRSGFAAESVDDAFVFAAMYDENGLTADRLPLQDAVQAMLVASPMLRPSADGHDAVWMNTIPDEPRRAADRHLPYFLLNLPRATILDLLHGRMMLIHLANPAKIADAIARGGFEVRPANGDDYRSGWDIRTTVTDDQGDTYGLRLGGLAMPMREMIMEFRSVEYITTVAEQMRVGIEPAISRVRATRSAS